jgi:hypothetical protein
VSSASLTNHDHQGHQLAANLQTFKPLSQHNRFVGIAMPVDVFMMFEVSALVMMIMMMVVVVVWYWQR